MNYPKYEDLRRTAVRHYNDNNFCTVVAVASVTGMSFGKARIKMQKAGRPHRKGAYNYQYYEVIKRRGYRLERIIGFEGHHVRTMGKKLKGKGNFLVQVQGHVLAVMDGVINDWAVNSCRRVKTVYKVIKD
jgi:hypothetical protein